LRQVRLSGYIVDEKVKIARRYLEPTAKASMGLSDEHVRLDDSALTALIQGYCREAGVRNLQKHVEKICRKVALKVVRATQPPPDEAEVEPTGDAAADAPTVATAEAPPASTDGLSLDAELRAAVGMSTTATAAAESGAAAEPEPEPEAPPPPPPFETIVIGEGELSDYVGKPTFTSERFYDGDQPAGVVTGLAWTSMGGAVLYIETQPVGLRHLRRGAAADDDAASADGGSGSGGGGGPSIVRTGQLGDVMKESSSIAHTYARSFLGGLGGSNTFLEEAALHMHVPEGATPKDGPSAGVTMVTSLLSLAMDRPARADLAMTGELSLTGRVLPIGGVKEKTIAARRAGVRHIIFPKANERDFAELPDILKEGVTPHFAATYDDVYRIAFGTDEEVERLVAERATQQAAAAAE
jgi:Lon-like ATP-dependent protease